MRSVRIHGQRYRVGEVVRARGRNQGHAVRGITPGGVPIISRVNVASLVADPEFAKHPMAQRVAALRKIGVGPEFIRDYAATAVAQITSDPGFARFGADDQVDILTWLVGPEVVDRQPAEVMKRFLGRST
jgi:hypothetical protein